MVHECQVGTNGCKTVILNNDSKYRTSIREEDKTMLTEAIRCPYCGAELNISEDHPDYTVCESCGPTSFDVYVFYSGLFLIAGSRNNKMQEITWRPTITFQKDLSSNRMIRVRYFAEEFPQSACRSRMPFGSLNWKRQSMKSLHENCRTMKHLRSWMRIFPICSGIIPN